VGPVVAVAAVVAAAAGQVVDLVVQAAVVQVVAEGRPAVALKKTATGGVRT
jgi:hypothetical protein